MPMNLEQANAVAIALVAIKPTSPLVHWQLSNLLKVVADDPKYAGLQFEPFPDQMNLADFSQFLNQTLNTLFEVGVQFHYDNKSFIEVIRQKGEYLFDTTSAEIEHFTIGYYTPDYEPGVGEYYNSNYAEYIPIALPQLALEAFVKRHGCADCSASGLGWKLYDIYKATKRNSQ